jgi:hypothetical protein
MNQDVTLFEQRISTCDIYLRSLFSSSVVDRFFYAKINGSARAWRCDCCLIILDGLSTYVLSSGVRLEVSSVPCGRACVGKFKLVSGCVPLHDRLLSCVCLRCSAAVHYIDEGYDQSFAFMTSKIVIVAPT